MCLWLRNLYVYIYIYVCLRCLVTHTRKMKWRQEIFTTHICILQPEENIILTSEDVSRKTIIWVCAIYIYSCLLTLFYCNHINGNILNCTDLHDEQIQIFLLHMSVLQTTHKCNKYIIYAFFICNRVKLYSLFLVSFMYLYASYSFKQFSHHDQFQLKHYGMYYAIDVLNVLSYTDINQSCVCNMRCSVIEKSEIFAIHYLYTNFT